MTDAIKIKCPNGCESTNDTPFYYPPYACAPTWPEEQQPELGVLAYPNAQPSNRFIDGTVGVSRRILKYICSGDDLPLCCECHDETVRE